MKSTKKIKVWLGILCVGFIIFTFSCKKGTETNPPEKPIVPVSPAPEKETLEKYDAAAFPANLISDKKNILQLEKDMQTDADLKNSFEQIIGKWAKSYLELEIAPKVSVDVKEDELYIGGQGSRLRVIAYYWLYLKFTGAPSSEYLPYIEKLKDALLKWANSNNVSTEKLPQETGYLGFFEAYSAIRNHIAPSDRATIDKWLMKKADVYMAFAPPRSNNWETIRVNFMFDLGYLLNNSGYLNFANNAYKALLNVNVLEEGKSEDLIKRDAFVYHAYNLFFYGKKIIKKQR